jgi:hypothetical protein
MFKHSLRIRTSRIGFFVLSFLTTAVSPALGAAFFGAGFYIKSKQQTTSIKLSFHPLIDIDKNMTDWLSLSFLILSKHIITKKAVPKEIHLRTFRPSNLQFNLLEFIYAVAPFSKLIFAIINSSLWTEAATCMMILSKFDK